MNLIELPTALRNHFANCATIALGDLARLLPMDQKTLRRHIAAGRLPCRFKGDGQVRRRRVFLEADVARFLASLAMEPPENIKLTPPRPPQVDGVVVFPSGMRMRMVRKRNTRPK